MPQLLELPRLRSARRQLQLRLRRPMRLQRLRLQRWRLQHVQQLRMAASAVAISRAPAYAGPTPASPANMNPAYATKSPNNQQQRPNQSTMTNASQQ